LTISKLGSTVAEWECQPREQLVLDVTRPRWLRGEHPIVAPLVSFDEKLSIPNPP